MQLDWFTVVAEIVNFLILVALLKYFLYDRIIGIADEREAKIATRFEEADKKRQKADKEAQRFRSQQQELDEQREALMSQAREAAEQQRWELIEQARQEIEAQREQWRQTVQGEQDAFLKGLRREAGQQTIKLARRTLADLAGADLEQQMIDRFLERLKELPDEEQAKIAESLQESDRQPVITTAFGLSSENREQLITAIRQQFGNSVKGNFNTAPDLICGIELKANDHKIAWSLANYLDKLADNLARVLHEELPRQEAESDEA